MTLFYVGLHHPTDAKNFDRCMVSARTLRNRKSDFQVNEWMLDSGAFREIEQYKDFRDSPEEYAARVNRWSRCGRMVAAVSQDYMCEPYILGITGLTVEEHQRRTIRRYDALLPLIEDVYLLPVLQGYWPEEYVRHLGDYGDRLSDGQWVGVGSVCKRNSNVQEIEGVLMEIKKARPDLRLHGFGVKTTALASSVVRDCLHSADSMAWSAAARWAGRDRNAWTEAEAFKDKIETQEPRQRFHQWRLW
jgi:hypothetical protein